MRGKEDVKQMEPEPPLEKSIDEILEEVDWEKLGVEGVEDQAKPSLAAEIEPPLVAKIEPPPAAKTGPAQPAKVEPPPPAHMELFHHGSDIEIVRKWFGWQTLLLTAFVVFWDWVTFSTFGAIIEDGRLLVLIFPAVGVLGTYYVIARWLNQTRIVVSRDKVTVRHGPLPWLGNRELEASNCRQFYRGEKEYRGKYGSTTRIYAVYASTHDGRSVKLVDGFTGLTSEQAYFIAQQIEKYLGLRSSAAEGGLFGWLH